ncbi:hypothetical protein OJF2_51620 [Aquisphaera giovannonii]|uniref:Uncharacterized protein n=1 Tax=Aquisphaera giovannonii TaxID=406548 RepID=A0A5B9W7L8_9BACT|nr:hypothetical protein [Aquisphaera giovannonii]QEH36578.1 hypothetical protein OJF2_51620 [Aquisphaera giovannonii]
MSRDTVPPMSKPLDCVGVDPAKTQVGKHDFQPSPTEPIVHGVGAVQHGGKFVLKERSPEDREAYYAGKIAELVTSQKELAAVTRERDAMKAALEAIKLRSPMTLLSNPPKDFAAEKARDVLTKLSSGELRKPSA